MRKQKVLIVPLFLLLAMTWLASCGKSYTFHGTVNDPPQPATAVVGTNWNGQPFQLRDQQGKVVVAFFGYTNCPDVCPLTLANMNEAYQKLGDKAKSVTFVFISTDPARDTPERLAAYVPAFNREFYGINIPEAALVPIKKAFGIYSEKHTGDPQPSADSYFVDHTGYVYIIDQKGQWRLTFPYDAPIDDIVADVEQLLAG